MKSGAISDRQISASSEYDGNHAAIQGRLQFQATNIKAGSWTPLLSDTSPWLQIDLANYYTKVRRVATQGRNQHGEWVTMYNLQYSDDGVNFKYYVEQGQSLIKVRKNVTWTLRKTAVETYLPLNIP